MDAVQTSCCGVRVGVRRVSRGGEGIRYAVELRSVQLSNAVSTSLNGACGLLLCRQYSTDMQCNARKRHPSHGRLVRIDLQRGSACDVM